MCGEGDGYPPREAARIERRGVGQIAVLLKPLLELPPEPDAEVRRLPLVHRLQQPARVTVDLFGERSHLIDEDRGNRTGRGEHIAVDGPAATLAPCLHPCLHPRHAEAEKGRFGS